MVLGHIKDQNRPIVIFLHGLGNDAIFPNLDFFRHLLMSGYNVVTTDLDGHGSSSTSTLSSTTIMTLAPDLIQQLDQIFVGRPRFHLVGYSFGAALLLDFAVHNPERVQSLSLVGMPMALRFNYGFMTEALSPFKGSYRQSLRDYGFAGIQPAFGPWLRGRYPVRVSEKETGSYLQVAATAIDAIDPMSKLRLVTFPTLCVTGSLDFIANASATAEFLDSIGIQHFTLKGETHFTSMLSNKMARRVEVLLRTSP